MKTIGESMFAKDAEGRLLSRIGTMFFHTPGLVTQKGVHAMQRLMWIASLNAERTAAGLSPLTPEAEEAEMTESADLIFTDDVVLIRPDPERMDLALRADEELQKLVSKRRIRFLNTNSIKVRSALMARGENWRMARHPISQEDMANLVEHSKVSIGEKAIYYYNGATGTRFITAGGYDEVSRLPDDEYRRQVKEVVEGLKKRNRLGQPEIDIFPLNAPIEVRKAWKMLDVDALDDVELRRAADRIDTEWRMALPPELREESISNYDWRNTMCHTITRRPNETAAEEQELVSGIAPEFYRQIEWLPGARIDRGEVIFDEIYDEAARTQDPELLALCDNRVKSFLFNTTRLLGRLAYINIGRIVNSLARHPVEGNRRGNVYIMQYREEDAAETKVEMIRIQKWGVAERLDEGKDLLQAIVETDEYSDYILDRRLMCRQLGMNLPRRLDYGHFTETYRGDNRYNGATVRTAYFIRAYIPGIASDKIPPARFRNPAFAQRFAALMGRAAALDLVVGRRSSVTHEPMFDTFYEVVQIGPDGLPSDIVITDHAGSFVEYERDYLEYVAEYARPVTRRRDFVNDYTAFVNGYVEGFRAALVATQGAYRDRRAAFDELFADRPYDTKGSGAFRWKSALARLDACDSEAVTATLRQAIG